MPAYPVPANQRSRNNVSNIISVGSVTRADEAGNQRLIQQQALQLCAATGTDTELLSGEPSVCNTKQSTKTLAFLYLLQFLKAPKAELLCQNQNCSVKTRKQQTEKVNPAQGVSGRLQWAPRSQLRFSLVLGTPPHKPLLFRISWPIHTKKSHSSRL